MSMETNSKSRKFGVVLPEELAERVEEPLEYGDSRSRRIRELVLLGLAAEASMTKVGYWDRKVSNREEMVSKALEAYLKGDI